MSEPLPIIDASAAELHLKMTEGDTIRFNWLVADVQWGGVTFRCQVKSSAKADADVLADLDVVATDEGEGTDILVTGEPSDSLTATIGTFYWDMEEVAGPTTRFSGKFYVGRQVSAP
jgi:hypothetical protein